MYDLTDIASRLQADAALMALDGWDIVVGEPAPARAEPAAGARWQWATPEPAPRVRRVEDIYEQPGMAVVA